MRWRILSQIKSEKPQERREEIMAALFKNRGLRTKKQREDFWQPKSPFDLTPKEVGISSVQLTKAVKRIKKAIQKKEKIIVYGDYDTDGVCATAIVWEALHQLGALVMPFIPKREEGYGLKSDRIDQLAKEGVRLIVTVDQGIVHTRQVAHAKKVGVEIVITDHHVLGKKRPKATAIIHTTELAGCGVAWFLAKELLELVEPDHPRGGGGTLSAGRHPGGEILDLVAIGTITDMVPLLGPNRAMVKFGLEALRKTKRSGLLALLETARIDKSKIGTYEVGFIIGPRLNASGRMEDPLEALRLVCTKDENRALALAGQIDQRNKERQNLTEKTLSHARELWQKEEQKSLVFIHHQSYEYGVIGLVASKLKDEFYRPAVVLAPRANHWVASARSIEEFNIIEAVRSCADILGDHGGHPRAAGFSVSEEKIEELKKRLIRAAEEKLDQEKLSPTLKVEAEVDLADLSFALYQRIEKFAPFGHKNPEPILATRGVEVTEARTVGRNSQHLKLRFTVHGSRFTVGAIAFNLGHLYPQLSSDQPIDIAYNLVLDEWNGEKRLQLKVRDIKVTSWAPCFPVR